MKVLYLTTEGFDTPGPNNQMIMVLIRELLNNGDMVHVIQSRREQKFPEIPDMLRNKEGLVIETLSRKVVGKKNFIIRYLSEVKWAFQSFSRWKHVKKDIDVVFLQSCPTGIFQVILLKMFCKEPILYNIYDMWPGNLLELGITKSRFLVNCFRWLQKFVYKNCDKLAVLSEDMKDKLIAEKVPAEKIVINPAWFDDTVVKKVAKESNRFINKYDIKNDKFIVQFAGTIGYTFDYKVVLKAAELLKTNESIHFQIIGDGSFKNDFVNEAAELGLNNIDFYPLQPIEIVPDVYSAADVEIIPLRPTTIGVGVPSKAPIVMACRTVIVNAVEKDSAYYKLFNANHLGISVPVGDSEKLANAIQYLFEHPDERNTMVENAYNYTHTYYSSTACTKIFIKSLQEIIDDRGAIK